VKNPIKHLAHNLIWNTTGQVWAVWRVEPAAYRHASRSAKNQLLADTEALIKSIEGEYRLISACGQLDPAATVERMINGVDLASSPEYAAVCEQVLDRLEAIESRERSRYLAVPLPEPGGARGALAAFAAAASSLAASAGAAPGRIKPSEVKAKLAQARALRASWPGSIELAEAAPAEILWLYARAPRRGLDEPARPRPGEGPVSATGLGALDEVLYDEGARTDRGRGARALNPFAHRHLKTLTEHGASYQAFLCLSEMPSQFVFPGSEWLAGLDEFDFPVEWAVCLRGVPRTEAEAKSRRQARELQAQVGEYTGDEGDEARAPAPLIEAIGALENMRERLSASSSELEVQASAVLCVYGESAEEAERRAETLRKAYAATDYQLSRPTGGQLTCYQALLPGAATPRMLGDYTQFTLARDFAMAMPFSGDRLGDDEGALYALGLSGAGMLPVLTDFSLGPRIDASASAAFVGELGSGKSVAMKTAAYYVLARGRRPDWPGSRGRVLAVDRTPNQEWVRFLKACPGRTQVIEISDHATLSLDPLRIFAGKQAARYTEAVLTTLLQVRTMTDEDVVLSEAIEDTVRAGSPSLLKLAKRLAGRGRTDPEAASLARKLRAIAFKGQARALFDPRLEPLSVSGADSIVFAVAGLTLPTPEELASEVRLARLPFEKIFGQAALVLLTAVCRETAFAAPHEFVLTSWDECWWMAGCPEGRALMLEMVRDSRKHNCAAHFGLHDGDDLGVGDEHADTLRGLLRLRYLFRHRTAALAAKGLEFMGLEGGDRDLLELVMGLSPVAVSPAERAARAGECLHRDLSGRLGLIKVLMPQNEAVARAILTTPRAGGEQDSAAPAEDAAVAR
jgi:hypothetical protein